MMKAVKWRTFAVARPCANGLRVARASRRGSDFAVSAFQFVPLQCNLLGDAPEVVGCELREKIAGLGWRERRWLLAVPVGWQFVERIPLPEMSAEDEAGYLWLQAERTLPLERVDTALATSRFVQPDGTRGMSLQAVEQKRLARVEAVFAEAGLVLGGAFPALGHLPVESGKLALSLECCGGREVLQASAGGGVVLLRQLQVGSNDERHLDLNAVQREVRLTLAGLPTWAQTADSAEPILLRDVSGRSASLAIGWNRSRSAEGPAGVPALMAAEDREDEHLAGLLSAVFNDRDSRVGWFARPVGRGNSTCKLGPVALRAICAAAGLVVLIGGGIAVQRVRLGMASRRLAGLAPQAEQAAVQRQQVRELSTWFHTNPRALDVLKGITASFPQEGLVWATRIALDADGRIQLAGAARDTAAWLAMQDALRETPEVQELRLAQTRAGNGPGKPMTFAVTFTWHETGGAQQ